jgi:hypothetical protein
LTSSDEEPQKEQPAPLAKKPHWNPGSYKYYMRYPKTSNSIPRAPTIGLVNKQVRAYYIVSIAFKIAKIAAVILMALLVVGTI